MTISLELILEILLNGLVISIAAFLLPFVYVRTYGTAVAVGILIAVVSAASAWFLGLLGIGVTAGATTLAGFLLTIFAIMIVDQVMRGFRVGNFWWAALFAVVAMFIDYLLTGIVADLL